MNHEKREPTAMNAITYHLTGILKSHKTLPNTAHRTDMIIITFSPYTAKIRTGGGGEWTAPLIPKLSSIWR
jgi:hypothetical protein